MTNSMVHLEVIAWRVAKAMTTSLQKKVMITSMENSDLAVQPRASIPPSSIKYRRR